MESSGLEKNIYRSRSQLDAYEDFSTLRASDLKIRIEEMLHIKVERYQGPYLSYISCISYVFDFYPTSSYIFPIILYCIDFLNIFLFF